MNKIIPAAIVASLALSAGKIQAQNTASPKKHLEHARQWELIYEKDIIEIKRNWSEIDAKDPVNKLFGYSNKSTRDVNLIDVLMNGIELGRVKVYADERFTKELSKEELHALLPKNYSPAEVNKYHVKEDRITAKTLNGMVTRIVGIGPVMGNSKDALFWIYYPEARKVLANANVNCDDYDTQITWDDVMEQRLFTERVTRVSEKRPGAFDLNEKSK